MAAISENTQICLSFGWLGSNQRTEKGTCDTFKVVYIYNLHKLPVCVQIPDSNNADPYLKPLPFVCGYGTDHVQCSTETLMVNKETLHLLSIKVSACAKVSTFALNRDYKLEEIGTTQKFCRREVELVTNFKNLEQPHYRLAINSQLKAFLLFETQKPDTLHITHFFDHMETANGLHLYLNTLLSCHLKKAANDLEQEFTLIPAVSRVRICTDFTSALLIERAIADGMTQSIQANQIVTLYQACQPLFLNWCTKTQAQKEESSKAIFKLFFDTCGFEWLRNIVQGYMLLLVNRTNDDAAQRTIADLSKEFTKKMIGHTLTISNHPSSVTKNHHTP